MNSTESKTLFELDPETIRYIYTQIYSTYVENPVEFANQFFDSVSTMHPKTLRIIAYELYTQGIDLLKLYSEYDLGLPDFLFSLNLVPNESMLVLLKYGFPPRPDLPIESLGVNNGGNLFVWWSLLSESQNSHDLSNLNWLDFILDVCAHLSIDLNGVNDETGETLLQKAISSGSLSLTLKLLCHGLDPNRKSDQGKTPIETALYLFNLADSDMNSSKYLNIIRQLVRYGATVDKKIQEIISMMSDAKLINKNIRAAQDLKPDYFSSYSSYFSLDPIEDLTLLAEIDPSIVYSEEFQKTLSGTNFNLYLKTIEDERKKTHISSNLSEDKILTWPNYIDETFMRKYTCNLKLEDFITVAELPSSEEVIKMALAWLPDISKVKQKLVPTIHHTETPASWKPSTNNSVINLPWGSRNLPPTPYVKSPPVMPIVANPLVPTGNPRLPQLLIN